MRDYYYWEQEDEDTTSRLVRSSDLEQIVQLDPLMSPEDIVSYRDLAFITKELNRLASLIKIENKCDSCRFEFGGCNGNPQFARESGYPLHKPKDIDAVVACDTWERRDGE